MHEQEQRDDRAALAGNPRATTSLVQTYLEELHNKYKPLREGTVADYIPELAKASPEWFSICIVTVAGEVYKVGHYDQEFTIQSASKPFMYGLALEDHGCAYVLTKVGVEPTGEAFNAIILDEQLNRPYNPMVNAGAIAIANLIKGADPTERLNRVFGLFQRYTGRTIRMDASVFVSERVTGHRNRAIAHLMRNFNMIEGNIDETLDLYFQQCALLVNCQDLAVMGATLANNGINPLTGEQAVATQYVKDILSVMYTCGMYNSSGEWAYHVGMPAKSGVGGAIIAVAPGLLGIGVFSPLLDLRGHSMRGVHVCAEISQRFGLHAFDMTTDRSLFCAST